MSVQSAHNGTNSAVSSLAATFGAGVGSGNLVRGFVAWNTSNTANLTSVSDDKGNAYSIVDKIADATDGTCMGSFYLGGITNSPTVITANLNTTSAMTIVASEESGLSTLALDGHSGQSQTNPGTGTNAISSGNTTTTIDGDLICSAVMRGSANLTNTVVGTGFSARESDTSSATQLKAEDLVQGTAGAISSTWTDAINGTSSVFTTLMMAFKVTAADGIGSSNMMSSPGRFIGWTA